MGHGRRSRSRSRDRSKAKAKSNGSSATTSGRDGGGSGGGGGGGGGGSRRGGDHHSSRSSRDATGSGRGGSRSRSRDRDRKGEVSSSTSRRDEGRARDGHHLRDRKSRRSDRDGDRDRKRSRRGGEEGRGERGDQGNPDEMWKRKLRDEDEQLKELDVDALLVDEEEEERRLEEQRRKRKEKLEALRRKKAEDDKAKAEAAARPEPPAPTAPPPPPAPSSNADDKGSPPHDRESPSSLATSTASAVQGGDDAPGGRYNSEEDPEEDDDDAGPIEITKQGTEAGDTALEEFEDESGGRDDDGTHAPGVRKGTKGGGIGGVSSSELEVQQGKEDRPVFDMFSAASLTAAAAGAGPGGKMGGKGGAHGMSYLGEDGDGDQGNWTDVEGYYKTRVGEVIGGRYTVLGSVGQGVFSTVLKCLDTRAGPAAVGGASEVALKMIRNNDIMRKAAQKEVALLKELAEHDPANRKHCIRMLGSLEHKQHVVMVFESMQMNLRETLNKFGRKTGINIHAVQKYGKQLMAALKHMASRNLVHADIKPDNILVDQGFGSLKLADFGSAFRESDPDNDPTPYLVSRYYRAPEIVMGLEYDKAIDLWSVAVTLFELYKGSVVLPGVNNNQMLKRMMDYKGQVPTRMVKNHLRAFETMGGIRPHFTEGGQFMQQEPDPVTGQTTVRLVTVTAPSRPVKSEIMRSKGAQDKKDTVADLADFLDKCMSLDPRQRMSLEQCSAHSFLRR